MIPMARIPKLRLLREKKQAALQEIARLEARIAELRSLVSDYEIADRVLGSLSATEDDDEIQAEVELETNSMAVTGNGTQLEVVRKKPDNIPTVPQMIYESLEQASLLFGAFGLEPSGMLEFVQKKYWPEAGSTDIGSTAWRLWKSGKLKKSGSIYSLPDDLEKGEQNAA
jgi:hypothetical protein